MSDPFDLRTQFVELAIQQLGKPYIWNADGPDYFDCSGFYCWLLKQLFVSDWGATHNCQKICDTLVPTKKPEKGDAVLYGLRGKNSLKASHLMIWVGDGRVIGASGGNRDTKTVEIAKAKGACVQFKPSKDYRPDFLGFRISPLDPRESTV